MRWRACALILSGVLGWTAAWAGVAALDVVARQAYRKPAAIPYPDDNPYSAAKADLGRLLFFDPILSSSKTLSCAGCHNPGLSWGDGLAQAVGEGNERLALRSPTIIDVAYFARFGWDGKFRDLESVAFAPITAIGNMNLSEPDAIARLRGITAYGRAFADAFGSEGISRRRIEQALATYERSIVANDAPFDRWVEGDETAIDGAAKRGFAVFNGKGRCAGCHSGWAFSDGSFHDIGSARDDDVGRGRFFPTSVKLRYAFKTPTLRDVARRKPYMHDGSVATLDAVIDLYDRGGIERPSRSELVGPLNLSGEEKADLLGFLRTLTSDPKPVETPVLPR